MTYDEIIEDVTRAVNEAMDIAIKQTKKELQDQGHVLTGELLNSIHKKTAQEGKNIVSHMILADHYEVVNEGVDSSRIPYDGNGGGGTSQYIQGLISFFVRRGKNLDEAKRAAFATANRHKVNGMPSRGSYRYSSNGRRTRFLDQAVEDSTPDMTVAMEKMVGYFQKTIDRQIRSLTEFKVSA